MSLSQPAEQRGTLTTTLGAITSRSAVAWLLGSGGLGATGCQVVRSHDALACVSIPATSGDTPLQVALSVDLQATVTPTVVRVSTAPAASRGTSRTLLHVRDGRHLTSTAGGGLRCLMSGHVLDRMVMVDVRSDRPAVVTVARTETGQRLITVPLPSRAARLDLRWQP